MADLDEFLLVKLAREMALNVRKYNDIFDDFKIDELDYYEIEKIPFYQKAKEQFIIEWNSTLSTKERIGVLSAATLEQGLLSIGARMTNPLEPLASVIQAANHLAKNAGIGEGKPNGTGAERFIITINLGSDVEGKPVIEHFDKPLNVESNPVAPNHTPPNLARPYQTAPHQTAPYLASADRNESQYEQNDPMATALAALMEH